MKKYRYSFIPVPSASPKWREMGARMSAQSTEYTSRLVAAQEGKKAMERARLLGHSVKVAQVGRKAIRHAFA